MTPPPIVAVAGIGFDHAGRVLLIQRDRPPCAGLWSAPGGKVEPGELLNHALIREIHEETGMWAVVGPLITVVDRIQRATDGSLESHFVIVDYLVFGLAGIPRPASDGRDARWFAPDELGSVSATSGLLLVIQRARHLLQAHGGAGDRTDQP